MKKCIATYIFFVALVLFSISGMANCVPGKKNGGGKAFTVADPKTAALQIRKYLKADHPGDHCPDKLCRPVYNLHSAGFSQTLPFLPEECPDLVYIPHPGQPVSVPATIELKGYLLHLFPSHYFW